MTIFNIKRKHVIGILAVVQGFAVFFLNRDGYFEILVGSLNGRGLLVEPLWLNLIILAALIFTLKLPLKLLFNDVAQWPLGIIKGLIFLAFPVLSGLALYDLAEKNIFQFQFNWPAIKTFVELVLAFVAVLLIWRTSLIKNTFMRLVLVVVFTVLPLLNYDQPWYFVLGIFGGLALTLILSAYAFKRDFDQCPGRAIAAQMTVGFFSVFWLLGVKSNNLFALVFPLIAMILGSILLRHKSLRATLIALSLLTGFCLTIGYVLPEKSNSAFFKSLNERKKNQMARVEKVGTTTIAYNDVRVRPLLIRLAKVVEAANQVSEQALGVSPQVRQLIVPGFAPGGFYAHFPDQIVGNFISPEYVARCLDSTYLTVETAGIDFPDPVNAILHEYTHLFGLVHYLPWALGAEEEGWATFGAVTLSQLLFRKYGQKLWDPPYDYAAFARAICDSNLQGRPVGWSHPEEFAGFQLWSELANHLGSATLFKKRWQLTSREPFPRWFFQNNPSQARQIAAAFGAQWFLKYAHLPAQPLSVRWPFEACWPLYQLSGLNEQQARQKYLKSAQKTIDPSIPLPKKRALWYEILFSMVVLILIWMSQKDFKTLQDD